MAGRIERFGLDEHVDAAFFCTDAGWIIGTEFTQRADFAAMARAFGAEGITVDSYSGLRDAVDHGLSCGKPCVIDVMMERDAIPPPVAGNWYEPERDQPEPMPRRAK